MTGIFQIFDRYKSKSYSKNDRRKSSSGEQSDSKASYYLVEDDGVARKVIADHSDRHSRPEASRDSRRNSNADVGETIVVKTLTSSKEPQTGTAQKPHSARPSTDSHKSSPSGHRSSPPRETRKETGGFKDSSKTPENYSPDAETPKLTVPSRSSVDHRSRDGHKLPPRDTRGPPKSVAHKDRSRTSVENVREVPAHLDDARDISRAILQMREAAKSPYDGREARRHSPSVARKDHVQRYPSSGDEREGEKYHRDGRRHQSSGDEKDAHRHQGADDSKEARRYSSVTSVPESYGEQAYDDEKDHHRPQFPSEGKDFVRSWHTIEGCRSQPSGHVKEAPRYVSSGDEMDSRRSNISSGDERGAQRVHPQSERRHRGSHDQESHRSYWPVDRDGQRHQSAGDSFEGLRDESSGDERAVQRPHLSARRRHHQGSGEERGHKYYSSRERGDGRRHTAYDAGRDSSQGLHPAGDERSAHRHVLPKDLHRKHSSSYYGGHRYQNAAAELNEHQRYQSAGEDQVGYRHHSSSGKGSRHQPSTSGYEGRRYQSSGDDRGGAHRSFVPAGGRDGGQRHDPPLQTYNSWRNESSDEEREVYQQQQSRSSVREDARRSSNAADPHRRYSLGNDDGHRHSSCNDDRRRDRSRSSVRDGSKYESAVDTRGVAGEYQNVRSNDGHGEWGFEEAAVAPSLPIPAPPKDGHRRNSSAETRGEHKRRGSNSSVVSHKDSLKLHLPGEKIRVSTSKDKDSSSGYSRDLPPRSSRSHTSVQVSPRNMMDIRDLARLNVQVRECSQTPALRDGYRAESRKSLLVPDSSQLSSDSLTGSYDFREMLRQIDFKDSQWTSEKFGVGSSRNSVDGRDPPRTSNVSRASVDSRQYQTSTPRLSVDGREHLRASSLHSSRASSVDAQAQLRTNSMDSSTSGEFKRRGPSVVARLMGLAELPEKDTQLSDRPQSREGKSLQKLLNITPPAEAASPPSDRGKSQLHLCEVAQQMKQVAARLHQDSQLRQKSVHVQQETRPKRKSKAKSRTQSRSRSPPPASPPKEKDTHGLSQHQGIFGRQVEPGSPLPRQPMSPKHHQMEGMPNVFKKRSPQELTSGDLDQRLHQLRIKNSIQEHRTLKQILEAMHLKGLLHPPPKKPPKPPRAEANEQGYLKEEAERPLHDFESKPSSSASNVARANRNDYQEQLNFEDLMRMDGEAHEDPALDIDHSGEASIVVMKPLNYHSVTPPASTKEIDVNSESASMSGFEREKIEIGHRRRGPERRSSSSDKVFRSHSLDPPEQRSADKARGEDLSFANVMLSWRERIAADAAKKATVEVAEVKTQSRSKSSALKHRAQDVSPLKFGASTENRVGSPRVQESRDENNREEYGSVSRKVLSDVAQEHATHDEDRFKIVSRSKSDLQLSAYSAETLAAMEANLERVPAQVAVLRSKRSSGKTSRSKEKLRVSHPADLRSRSSPTPSSSNLETCSLTDELARDPHLQDLSPIKIMSPMKMMSPIKIMSPIRIMSPIKVPVASTDSRAQGECTVPSLKVPEESSRMTPKKRKIAEPAVVLEEEEPQLPAVATTPEVKVPVSSNVEDDYAQAGELSPLQCDSVADGEAEESEDAKMEDAFDEDTSEAHTPEGFASGRDKCFSEDGAFNLQGADHPSPVSVLDSPIFQEGFHLEELTTSPDSAKSSMLRHEDAEDTLQQEVASACEQEAEALTPKSRASREASNPLRDIYTKVARSLELGEKEVYQAQPSADLQIPTSENAAALISGDHSKGRLYVQGILMESGLTDGASLLAEDATEVMEFDVFTRKEEELQTAELERIDRGELEKTEEKRYKESLDRRLIFDCMNEILERKMSLFLNPQPWGAPVVRRKPCGQRLVDEVWDELKDMHWPTTVAYDALYAVLQKDFMRKGFQWLDFSVEVGDVGCELEHIIFQELVEEAVHDVMNIKSKPVKLQHLTNLSPAPSPCDEASPVSPPPSPLAPSEAQSEVSQAPSEVSAVSSDDSERRRRELLDKTRRDLLAWHVQYQQM